MVKVKLTKLNPKMRVFSVCSGVGGFELGLDSDKFKLIGFSEVDKYCNAILNYHWPEVKNYGDITQISKRELPDFDLLVGGTPCQDWSISGKRKGIDGDKSRLFIDFIKILRAKRPSYFIWENVPGVLNANAGWDFARVQFEMVAAGYSCRWEVLNAADFGVPQNRERLFVVGSFGGRRSSRLFPKGSSGREDSTIRNSPREYDNNENKQEKTKLNFYGGIVSNEKPVKVLSRNFSQGNRVCDAEGLNPTLSCNMGGASGGSQLIAYSKSTREKHTDHRVRVNDNANTLTSGKGCQSQSTSNFVCSNKKIRRLVPLECERLMGWPSNHTNVGVDSNDNKIYLSDSQRYKMCGNGVVSTVVKSLAQVIWRDWRDNN